MTNLSRNFDNKRLASLKTTKLSLCIAIVSALSACGGGGGGSSGGGGPSPIVSNTPPVLSGETQYLVSSTDALTLTVSATDAENDTISFNWTQLNGESVTNPAGANTSAFSFNAPESVDTLQFRVTATAAGQSDTQTVSVIILEDIDTAIFIDNGFSGTGDGSLQAPFTTLAQAIVDSPDDSDFYIKRTPNSASTQLWDASSSPVLGAQSIYGAYNDDWTRDLSRQTQLLVSEEGLNYRNIDSDTTVSGIDLLVSGDPTRDGSRLGIDVRDGSAKFTVSDTNIVVEGFADTVTNAIVGNVFGINIVNVETTQINNNQISVGDAAKALDAPPNTSPAQPGNSGQSATEGFDRFGGDGGSGGGGNNGGRGGDGSAFSNSPGEDGADGNGRVTGGAGGVGGYPRLSGTNGVFGNRGDDGLKGNNGESGIGGSGFGSIASNGSFRVSFPESGQTGNTGGGGGGGGGGGAGAGGLNGGGGGGGGEGGAGGQGGSRGNGGLASIALQISGGSMHLIESNIIISGNGGEGGLGGLGAPGGAGGSGGSGADGNQAIIGSSKGGKGGNGGDGGDGGDGGAGGSGGGGPSFGIFIGGNTPAMIQNNTITTGNGGKGGNARLSNETIAAGDGGWSVGIFDGNINDSLTPTLNNNTYTIGLPGESGSPKTGGGVAQDTNVN